jgi:hypothetical protein
MARQEFDTVDVLRLEVETDPAGLVNLVQNPSGELGGWGWITTIVGSKVDGGTALTYTGVAGASWFTTEEMPVAAGQYAAARWNATAGTAGYYFRARFEWINSAGAVISSSTQTGYLARNSGVGNLGAQLAPVGTVWARLRFDVYATNTGTNPAGAHTFTLAEVTVAKAATSGSLGAQRTNLVPNPSFEVNTTGWAVVAGPLARTTSQAYSGSASLQHTKSGLDSGPVSSSGAGGMPVTGGLTYAARGRVKAGTGAAGERVRIRFTWFDSGASSLGSSAWGTDVTASGTSWLPFSVTAVAPAAAAFAQLEIGYRGAPSGAVFYYDAFIVEQAASVGSYFDGATPDAGGWDYGWSGTAHQSASTAVNSTLGYLDPVQYLDVIGESHEIKINREELQVGTLDAVIISRTLDPADSALIRPGRRARLRALVSGVWEELITGKLLVADVEYELKNPSIPDEKRARITVNLVDAGQPLSNAKRPQGVATIAELPFVLEGAGVPWNVNGSGNQVATATPTTFNDNASALSQVALTRDTRAGYAWVSRRGVVNAWDPGSLPAPAPIVLDEDDYSDLKVTFGTDDCINACSFTVQTLGVDGTTTETTYGPYEDAASIEAYGRYLKEFTVTGLSKAQVDTLAAAILAANKTPVRRVQSVTIPLNSQARIDAHALRELYDLVQVNNTEVALSANLRVTGIEHTIQLKKWLLTLTFAANGAVASPLFQPPVQSDASPDVGVIEMFAGPTSKIPSTKLLCDGSSKAVASYPYLFAVIGYTFGGSGANFNVPNLVDRFPIGAGTKALGTTGGGPTKTLTEANLPPHSLNIGYKVQAFAAGGVGAATLDGGGPNWYRPANVGSGTAFDVMNPWLALTPVIRAV